MTTFDIATKIVSSTQRAFVVHAGRERRNHGHFIEESIAFLEIPNFDLTPEIARSRPLLRRAMRRQMAREAYGINPVGQRPTSELNAYSGDVLEDGSLTRTVASIHGLYSRMKPGDIVITPGFEQVGKYRRPIVNFGEIASAFSTADVFNGPTASSDRVPFRKVKWLNKIPRRELPPQLELRIGRPPAVRQIEITEETEQLLDFTYSNYIYENGSSSLIEASRYTGEKFGLLNDSSRLIEILAAAYAYANQPDIHRIDDIKAFRQQYFAASGVENIVVDFSSPGHWRIIGGTVTLGAFVALGVAILTSNVPVGALQAGVTVTNSASASQEEPQKIEDSMNIFLRSLTVAELEEIKGDAEKAAEEIGFKSRVQMVDE
ncbi:hypothetical protein [Devosia sp. 2618]|uniref:hypothetical protein n=1 Tax=Devosia sp. 2618 TaxID=3156454 RepID=UPI003393329A